MTALYILGTHHKHQFGPCRAFENDDQATEKFTRYLKNQCIHFGIKTLAEEMSEEAKTISGISYTVPEFVAHNLGIDHSYCDPDTEERRTLGIVPQEIIKMNGLFDKVSEETLHENMRLEYDKREVEWINRITLLSKWPILFICGFDHSLSFTEKAKTSGLQAYMIAEQWTPN